MRVTNLIEQVLRDYPETRDSDKKLILKVWELEGLFLTDAQQDKFLHLPSTETVRRVRQKIQELGKYKASDRVKEAREWKAWQMEQNTPTAAPKRVEDISEAHAVQVRLEM